MLKLCVFHGSQHHLDQPPTSPPCYVSGRETISRRASGPDLSRPLQPLSPEPSRGGSTHRLTSGPRTQGFAFYMADWLFNGGVLTHSFPPPHTHTSGWLMPPFGSTQPGFVFDGCVKRLPLCPASINHNQTGAQNTNVTPINKATASLPSPRYVKPSVECGLCGSLFRSIDVHWLPFSNGKCGDQSIQRLSCLGMDSFSLPGLSSPPVPPGTEKVRQALGCKHLHITSPDWLWCCLERWEKVEEQLYPLKEEYSKTPR